MDRYLLAMHIVPDEYQPVHFHCVFCEQMCSSGRVMIFSVVDKRIDGYLITMSQCCGNRIQPVPRLFASIADADEHISEIQAMWREYDEFFDRNPKNLETIMELIHPGLLSSLQHAVAQVISEEG